MVVKVGVAIAGGTSAVGFRVIVAGFALRRTDPARASTAVSRPDGWSDAKVKVLVARVLLAVKLSVGRTVIRATRK